MKMYTLGEIWRRGLLKSKTGKPYTHKATVRNMVLQHMKYNRVTSKWGKSFAVSDAEIKKFNRRHGK